MCSLPLYFCRGQRTGNPTRIYWKLKKMAGEDRKTKRFPPGLPGGIANPKFKEKNGNLRRLFPFKPFKPLWVTRKQSKESQDEELP